VLVTWRALLVFVEVEDRISGGRLCACLKTVPMVVALSGDQFRRMQGAVLFVKLPPMPVEKQGAKDLKLQLAISKSKDPA
jgi:hypothetical protein